MFRLNFKMLNMERIFIVTTVLLLFNLHGIIAYRNLTFLPIVYEAEYEKEYELLINTTVEYEFLYPTNSEIWMETARIKVESNATHDLPLIIVARHKKGILSWQIPLVVDSLYFNDSIYNKTSRTLCSTENYNSEWKNIRGEFVTITLSTADDRNVLFKLNVTHYTEFYLRTGEKRSTEISPSEPIYYGYIFQEQMESPVVIVHVESESDICMTVSIQNISCPVFDLERNIQFAGYWQTVSRQGGITVPREAYPMGFFVVLVVKGDDTDCYGSPNTVSVRNKNVSITVNPGVTKRDYVIASSVVISLIFGFCIVYVMGITFSVIKEGKKIHQELLDNQICENNDPMQTPFTIEEIQPRVSISSEEDSSLDEDDIDILQDVHSDKAVIRTKLVLSVSDLARKHPKILRHKSRLYLYYLITITIFYTLPVLQLVVTYQNILHITGNQDICYYNFLCAHPLGLLSDFNHVFSNFGYIILGLLFILVTYTREKHANMVKNQSYGIPQHYGLFYALGFALIMEGILSGSYHVCPNRSNFQFDTSYMYIIAILCMIKIYQTRHPDINARAPITFGVLALIILTGLIGVLDGSTTFWIIFTIMYLLICLFVTIQFYYMGRCRLKGISKRIVESCKYDVHSGVKNLFKPLYPGRFTLLAIANLCNVGLAVFGNLSHEKNFATFLLIILMFNLMLYTIFYIGMKMLQKEKILPQPLIYIILAVAFWIAAMYFFINKTISWAVTPAKSRLYNKPCYKFLRFFDNHDIWHFLSGIAIFFSFMVLLTLDDDLVDVHRSQILVF
ncbi:SID1 transmembrane family member 1-like [Colletes gigas]|uniref:SID1 transmembrane family member 1-like n=1 Tax=Colletes gigas TaxID=935657 RepID=UPI001C9AF86F|nr:SID1 transmembrane family member 1-like [Colletes gigas]